METLIQWRRGTSALIAALDKTVIVAKAGNVWNFLFFVVASFAILPLVIVRFLLELPLHYKTSTMDGFTKSAIRSSSGQFLESYSGYMRRNHASVAIVMLAALALVAQFTFFGYSIWTIGRPSEVAAQSGTIDINPSWDDSVYADFLWSEDGPCTVNTLEYLTQGPNATNMKYGKNVADPSDCFATIDYHTTHHRPAIKFSLSSIPNNATITSVNFVVNVSNTSNQLVAIHHPTSDSIDTLTPQDAYTAIEDGTTYVNATWSTTGSKNLSLGSTAVSDVQSRISSSDIFALGLKTDELTSQSNNGAIDSVNHGTAGNRPILRVAYTIPPTAPSGFAHTSNTTSTIAWAWTDNATGETRYDVRDGSGNVAGCTNLAANSVSCTETGLSTNTQYSRTARVTDADGTADSASASAYTSIQTPSGISFGTITPSSIIVSDSGTFSNLSSGSSGIFFQENITSTNSGWLTSNSWTKGSLTANTQYSFQAETRNGDAEVTSFTSAATKYTLSATPNITSTQTTSTWYSSSSFPFTNAAGWGSGGVQYYRYTWDTTSTHSFVGSESTWSNLNANCPGGTCTDAGTTLTKTATSDSNSWYLHVQAFNGDNTANGSGSNYGPYYFDGTNPTAPATVNDGTGADATYSTSLTTLSANWTTSTDATSGLQKYQYAIGTTSGGTQTLGYTDNGTATSFTNSGLTLSNGTTYYVSVRAVDNASNTGGVTTSNGITINTSLPSITDNQPGDTTVRNTAGTTYNVDFNKAASGPQLDSAQYTVYSAAGKTGTQLKDWTDIFTVDTNSYTTDWPVDFSSLTEGTNYVSVRVTSLDALTNELDDVFTVIKDTVGPVISAVAADAQTTTATISWTTNEAATSQVRYGVTSAYGSTTTLNTALTTSHTEAIQGLTASTTYHYQVISADGVGNSSASADATFTTAAEAAGPTPTTTPPPTTTTPSSVTTPTITNLGEGSVIADTKPILAGTGPAKGTIFVVVDRKLVRTVLVDSAGRYHVALSTDLSLGAHQFVVRAKTTTGAVSDESQPITVTIVKSSVLATVQKTILTDGSHPGVTYYVVAPGQSTIKFLLDGSLYKTLHAETVIGAYGFILKLDIPSTLTIGQHQFSLFTIDRYGRPSHQVGIVKFMVPVKNTQPIIHYGQRTYIVRSGDSLWSIAKKFYGNGRLWTSIRDANVAAHPSLRTSPQTIYGGWTLTIPAS